jgi:hypothetical protein
MKAPLSFWEAGLYQNLVLQPDQEIYAIRADGECCTDKGAG